MGAALLTLRRVQVKRVWTIVLADRVVHGEDPSLPVEAGERDLLRALLHKRLEECRINTQQQMDHYGRAPSTALHQQIEAAFEKISNLEAALGRLLTEPSQEPSPKPPKSSQPSTHQPAPAMPRKDRLDYTKWDELLDDDSGDEEEAAKQVVQDRVRKGVHKARGVEGHMDLINKIMKDPTYAQSARDAREGEWTSPNLSEWQEKMKELSEDEMSEAMRKLMSKTSTQDEEAMSEEDRQIKQDAERLFGSYL